MKNKEYLKLIIFIFGISYTTEAQNLPVKRDTIHLKLNDESTTILVPPPGKKTTVIFEDTGSLIQVSILKLNKMGNIFPFVQQENSKIEPQQLRTKKWFNEISMGLVINNTTIANGNRNNYQKQVSFDTAGENLSLSINNFIVPRVGIRGVINIKESSWPFLKSSTISFISGYRLYIDYSRASGDASFFEKGLPTYVGKSSSYNLFNQLVIPMGFAKKFGAKSTFISRMEAGLALGLSVKYAFDRFKSPTHASTEGDDITANVASQIYLKLYRKNLFFTLSREMNERTYGRYRNEKYNTLKNHEYRIYQTAAYTGLISFGIGYRFG